MAFRCGRLDFAQKLAPANSRLASGGLADYPNAGEYINPMVLVRVSFAAT